LEKICEGKRCKYAGNRIIATTLGSTSPLFFLSTLGQSAALRRTRHPMEEAQAAVMAHLDQVSGLVQALSAELRRGIGPAADSLLAFVRAVDWTVTNSPIPRLAEITDFQPPRRAASFLFC
jgi:hypothetical protein